MTPSVFNRAFPCVEIPGRWLLYSTKRRSIVRVTEKILRDFEAGRLSPADAALFRRLELVVPDRTAEGAEMAGYFDRLNTRPGDLDLTVVLTMACNFACPYCFEGDLKGDRRLLPETADQLVTFAATRLSPDAVSGLNVTFYGGEPLLAEETLCSLARRFKDQAEHAGKPFRFSLVSNGSLLTPKTVDALVPLGLTQAQVTLDGPPRLHDRTRPFAYGGDSFWTILNNLKAVADQIKIVISGNYGPENWPGFIDLLELLAAEGLGPDRVAAIRFSPIMQQAADASSACFPGCLSLAEPWLAKSAIQLREAILQHGFRVPRPGPLHCMVEMDHSFVVDWNGIFYKCPAFIGRPRFAIGDIQTGPGPANAYRPGRWKTDKCFTCPYLPQCFGGCRYMSYVSWGNLDHLDCSREWFDAVLPEMVWQDLRYGNNSLKPQRKGALFYGQSHHELLEPASQFREGSPGR